jgi:hypothetical protein
MNHSSDLPEKLRSIMEHYQRAFSEKQYEADNNEHDLLMDVFGLTPEIKRENRQYWSRELGMCWQMLIVEIFRHQHPHFGPALRMGDDEPCDLIAGDYAIDTKYRIGSGDSGTLKKFKSYGALLQQHGYTPTLLILRTDNLPAAITAFETGGWQITSGEETFRFIKQQTGFDVREYLAQIAGAYRVDRLPR